MNAPLQHRNNTHTNHQNHNRKNATTPNSHGYTDQSPRGQQMEELAQLAKKHAQNSPIAQLQALANKHTATHTQMPHLNTPIQKQTDEDEGSSFSFKSLLWSLVKYEATAMWETFKGENGGIMGAIKKIAGALDHLWNYLMGSKIDSIVNSIKDFLTKIFRERISSWTKKVMSFLIPIQTYIKPILQFWNSLSENIQSLIFDCPYYRIVKSDAFS